ncbi:response regulator [Microvirga brassicacearum]|uniref:Response regulator n=1 Tax=Microvirga brassicacearum TaxID=2580413 RepID=A0A5N3P916_9HYPH|nr:response regulator [Microvirga brassicacearum]KAB0266213.1 response regulator [Microvirga brassicacearum]
MESYQTNAQSCGTSAAPCCLIVEDQVLIGMSVEAYLEEIGYEVVGPLTSSKAALDWLEENTPDFAILDYALADGSCSNLAAVLKARHVPFVIYSGHPRSLDEGLEMQDVPWIEKPAARMEIIKAIERLPVRGPLPR